MYSSNSRMAKRNKSRGIPLGSTVYFFCLLAHSLSYHFDASIEFILANCIDISFRLFAIVYITHITKTSGAIVNASNISTNIAPIPSILFPSPLFC